MERYERINALAKIISATSYLEIGVFEGINFNQIEIPYKVGVDPLFLFNVEEYADETTIFHKMTSDKFFSDSAPTYGKFDLIFLDGLHTFEQTFRDFCASIGYSHDRTIWLIDDTRPNSWFASFRRKKLTRGVRKLLGIKTGNWMGDVFKVVFAIHDFFPQYRYVTFPGLSQTVIWTEPRRNFSPTWNSLGKISRMGYRDYIKFKDSHIPTLEDSEILSLIEHSFRDLPPTTP